MGMIYKQKEYKKGVPGRARPSCIGMGAGRMHEPKSSITADSIYMQTIY